MPIDHVGSMVNLAKQWRMDFADMGETVNVPKATLLLLLNTLVDLGSPDVAVMQQERARGVADMLSKRAPTS